MPSAAPLSILQISDLHLLTKPGQKMSGINTEESFCQVLEYAHDKLGKVDLILVTGDLSQTPCQFAYQRIVQELEKYKTRTVCLPGNHDDPQLMRKFINGQLINCDQWLKFDHWQIISLNSKKQGSEGGFLAPGEMTYLTDTLKKNPKLNTLLAVHHQPIPTQSAWLDTMMIENNEQLLSLLHKHPQVKALTFGHIHQQLEKKAGYLLILGTPSTCFQFKPLRKQHALDNKPPGYRIIQLFGNGSINSKVHYLPQNQLD